MADCPQSKFRILRRKLASGATEQRNNQTNPISHNQFRSSSLRDNSTANERRKHSSPASPPRLLLLSLAQRDRSPPRSHNLFKFITAMESTNCEIHPVPALTPCGKLIHSNNDTFFMANRREHEHETLDLRPRAAAGKSSKP